ncbi:type I restriction-modification system subunit M [Paraburkholderia sp. MM6662-R1]|uniref:type I restriction-modification system subunit M n=1 Tax=Paraburkholderia sp. MM6662-R1 TaxID=2991066 RepID=UPI003D24178F
MAANFNEIAWFIWSVADLLRGDYKQSDYGKVILPFTLLRRMDCVLEPTKAAVLKEFDAKKDMGIELFPFLTKKAGQTFYNASPFDFEKLQGDPAHIKANLTAYVNAFSENARDIFDRYDFLKQLDKLDDSNLLYLVTQKFAGIDLHPERITNADMGLLFEELIRRFAELSNETAGEHYTPREVIRLMVDLLFTVDDDALSKPGVVRTVYDPAAGTGGMLSISGEHLRKLNPDARLVMFGQELNAESYAICKADMLIKGQDVGNIAFGNTLSDDQHAGKDFDYMLSNPPFGVEWKKVEKDVRKEHEQRGYEGRFGPGLPRVSDGSLLFLMHLLAKMRPYDKNKDQGGSRVGIVLNGSPLFTGGAGSGESEIRRWIIENDWLEAIVALPTDMFYNTGIATYVWILTNKKSAERKGKVQLINAAEFYGKMRKSLGSKRRELGETDVSTVVEIHGRFEELRYVKVTGSSGEVLSEGLKPADEALPQHPDDGKVESWMVSRIFDNADFGYSTITVERPLRNERGEIERDKKGKAKADAKLRDTENVPLKDDIDAYFMREVHPHVPDAWIDEEKTKVGYEIPFNRFFYQYTPPRPLEVIDAELKAVTSEILALLQEVTE